MVEEGIEEYGMDGREGEVECEYMENSLFVRML